MRVFQFPGQPTTNPRRETPGITFALRGGDVCDPMFGNWFNPPWPRWVIRFLCPIPILPWISWNLFGKQGYAGFKVYGADSDAYTNWMRKGDVYQGSQAMCFSVRFRIND